MSPHVYMGEKIGKMRGRRKGERKKTDVDADGFEEAFVDSADSWDFTDREVADEGEDKVSLEREVKLTVGFVLFIAC